MKKTLPFAAAFALGLAVGWAVTSRARPTTVLATEHIEVRSIAVSYPDPSAPDGQAYRVLKVFSVSTDRGIISLGDPVPGNWIITLSPREVVAGKGQVTYHASPQGN